MELLDQEFAGQVQAIAQEINAGKLLDQSSMTQNNYGSSKGWQAKVEGERLFPDSAIFDLAHVQIDIRNPTLVTTIELPETSGVIKND